VYKSGYAVKIGILPEMEKRKEGWIRFAMHALKNAAGQVPLMA
jgi:hypothetical protein